MLEQGFFLHHTIASSVYLADKELTFYTKLPHSETELR